MKQSIIKFSCIALLGATCVVRPAMAYVIPIASMVEWPHEIMLLFESEIKRWEHEAIKYKEMLFTDMMGATGVNAQGQGSLGISDIIGSPDSEIPGTLKTDAMHGASAIDKTIVELKCAGGNTLVENLSDYNSAKSQIEGSYIIKPEKLAEYTQKELDKIKENQRVAINDLAKSAVAMSGIETVVDTTDRAMADPKTAAEDIAAAQDMNAMFELMTGMDQRLYEKSLRMSNMEATDVELKAMQSLKGLDVVNPNQGKEEK